MASGTALFDSSEWIALRAEVTDSVKA